MKVCLINIHNCINYSQYGPFFYEKIKSGELAIYNDVKNIDQLKSVRESILEEINRNAFRTDKVKLIVVIPRNMADGAGGEDYEFYNEINIYLHLTKKLPFFAEIITIYVDTFSGKNVSGALYRDMQKISDRFVSDLPELQDFLIPESIVDDTGFAENYKRMLSEKAKSLKNRNMSAFFGEVIDELMPDKIEDEGMEELSFFALKCAERIPHIERKYESVQLNDISDSINKRLKIIYFIIELIDGKVEEKNYDSYAPDYEKIKTIICTQRLRLERWLQMAENVELHGKKKLQAFQHLANAHMFKSKTEEILRSLAELDMGNVSAYDAVHEVFEKLEKIVDEAWCELAKFTKKELAEYYNDDNYSDSASTESYLTDRIDAEEHEKKLLENLNHFKCVTLPGENEQRHLEAKLENANKCIQQICRSKNEYTWKHFLKAFLYGGLGVALLYLFAQFSVFVKEHTFWVYGVYSGGILILFLTTYVFQMLDYKRRIKKISRRCKDSVREYLDHYVTLAEDFEQNLNAMADYYCFKAYLDCWDMLEKEQNDITQKFLWHKRKVREILDNTRHFSDFMHDGCNCPEDQELRFEHFNDDAEHTEFYQMKIF